MLLCPRIRFIGDLFMGVLGRVKARNYVHSALELWFHQAYQEDLARFLAWGARTPSLPEVVATDPVAHREPRRRGLRDRVF
jgi:hypothetical protein